MTRPASTPRKRTGGAVKAAAPVEEPEAIESDEEDEYAAEAGVDASGRPWARFTFRDRSVVMLQPTKGQEFVLLQTLGITDELADDQEKMELALGFATMIRALHPIAADRQYVTGALARGVAEIEDYFELAREMAEHWGMETEAPANNRQERRARERRPVAQAKVRPRR